MEVNEAKYELARTLARSRKSEAILAVLLYIYFGRQNSTVIEPILDSLYNLLLNYQLLQRKLTNLDQLVSDLIKPERVMKMDFLL